MRLPFDPTSPTHPVAKRSVVRRAFRLSPLIAYSLLLAIGSRCLASAPPVDPSEEVSGASSDELYSGIECLQVAARILGRPVDMVELLSSVRSQSQREGISREMFALASDRHLNPVLFDDFRNEQIESCRYPLLMHVKGGRYSIRPDWYVLFHGSRDGKVSLYSPSAGEISLPIGQLEEDRRGEVILLSAEPLPANTAFAGWPSSVPRYGLMLGVLFVPTLMAFKRSGRSNLANTASSLMQARDALRQFAGLAIITVFLAFACRVSAGQRLLPSAPAAAGSSIDFLVPQSEDGSNSPVQPAEISVETALSLYSAGVLFVDARDLADFNAGHIAGAVLCPASDVGRWHLHMAGIAPQRKIVVYCAAASCGKGVYVARCLLQNGFTDVCLYRDGWAKWTGPKEPR